MKHFIFLLLIVFNFTAYACVCETPKPAVEFYTSKFVFIGEVIEKKYAPDFQTYTVSIKVKKHYKNNPEQEMFNFTFSSEGEYTGVYTSCDWNLEVGETWLIYAKENEHELSFQYYCSNSKRIKNKLADEELKVLENGNTLDLNRYTYLQYEPFLEVNIDSILDEYKQKKYKPRLTVIVIVDIDKNGKLVAANFKRRSRKRDWEVIDTIFDMNVEKNIEYHKPTNEFEKSVLQLTRSIENWKPRKNSITNDFVKARFSILFWVNEEGKIEVRK